MNIIILEKSFDEVSVIKPLWEGLNAHHLECSTYFKSKYEKFTFEKRMEALRKKTEQGEMKLYLLYDSDTQKYKGYSLGSICDGQGEVESIYIDKSCRKSGFGGALMEKMLAWFRDKEIDDIAINVVYDNQEALPFYKRYGFNISTYVLKRSNK